MTKDKSKKWYSRGYLPHFDVSNVPQFITFRLGDSLPQEVLNRLKYDSWCKDDSEKRKYLENSLDEGYGECYLKDPYVAKIVEDALIFFHEDRYRLYGWVIMPNHVHVLIEVFENFQLNKIVRSWKSFTGRKDYDCPTLPH